MDSQRKDSGDTKDGFEMADLSLESPTNREPFIFSYISDDGLGPGLPRPRSGSNTSTGLPRPRSGTSTSTGLPRPRSGTGTSTVYSEIRSARPPVRPRTTVSIGECSLLNEMEGSIAYYRREDKTQNPKEMGRFRSGSNMPYRPAGSTLYQRKNSLLPSDGSADIRLRKNSLLHSDGSNDGDPALFNTYNSRTTPLRAAVNKVIKTVQYLTPTFYYRMNIYGLLFFFVVMLTISDTVQNADQWFKLYFAAIGLEFSMSILDRMVFKLIDVVFYKYYELAYLLHSINGPLGMLLTAILMHKYFGFFNASEIFPAFKSFLSAFTVIVICLCIKNWYSRQQYIYLLEQRFSEKLKKLDTWTIILSELASTRPPKSLAIKMEFDDFLAAKSKKVKNVFLELVSDSMDDGDLDEDTVTRRDLYSRRKHFWKTASRLNSSAGNMHVLTYNGAVHISSQVQAKVFGKQLHKHLSKGGKNVVNRQLLQALFEERRGINAKVAGSGDGETHGPLHGAAAERRAEEEAEQTEEHVEESQELYEAALALFDPEGVDEIGEDYCVNAVLAVYKEQRFSAASIRDYGQLHQSLRIGIDAVFWVIMSFVLQAVFGFVLTDYLLPFITLILSFSFSLATVASNYLLAFAFVFFMAPFDIGHKVRIVFTSGADVVDGHVKSITLLHTIVTTLREETIKIPNHVLFSSRIYNLYETTASVHEFVFCFNLNGGENNRQETVTEFFRRLKYWALCKSGEYRTFLVTSGGMNSRDNSVEYRVYCTHRESWQYYLAASQARIAFVNQVMSLQKELGLRYMALSQPVEIINSSDPRDEGTPAESKTVPTDSAAASITPWS